jgi:hypothetical protein
MPFTYQVYNVCPNLQKPGFELFLAGFSLKNQVFSRFAGLEDKPGFSLISNL